MKHKMIAIIFIMLLSINLVSVKGTTFQRSYSSDTTSVEKNLANEYWFEYHHISPPYESGGIISEHSSSYVDENTGDLRSYSTSFNKAITYIYTDGFKWKASGTATKILFEDSSAEIKIIDGTVNIQIIVEAHDPLWGGWSSVASKSIYSTAENSEKTVNLDGYNMEFTAEEGELYRFKIEVSAQGIDQTSEVDINCHIEKILVFAKNIPVIKISNIQDGGIYIRNKLCKTTNFSTIVIGDITIETVTNLLTEKVRFEISKIDLVDIYKIIYENLSIDELGESHSYVDDTKPFSYILDDFSLSAFYVKVIAIDANEKYCSDDILFLKIF